MTKRYSDVMRELAKAREKARKATDAELARLKRIRDQLAKGKK